VLPLPGTDYGTYAAGVGLAISPQFLERDETGPLPISQFLTKHHITSLKRHHLKPMTDELGSSVMGLRHCFVYKCIWRSAVGLCPDLLV